MERTGELELGRSFFVVCDEVFSEVELGIEMFECLRDREVKNLHLHVVYTTDNLIGYFAATTIHYVYSTFVPSRISTQQHPRNGNKSLTLLPPEYPSIEAPSRTRQLR